MTTTSGDNNEVVILHGYLQKQSRHLKLWKLRYFKLTPISLSYTKQPTDTKPKASFELENIKVIPEGCKIKQKPFAFALKTKKRLIYLSAATLEERLEWVNKISSSALPSTIPPPASIKTSSVPSSSYNSMKLSTKTKRRKFFKRKLLSAARKEELVSQSKGKKLSTDLSTIESKWINEILISPKKAESFALECLCFAGIPKHLRGRAWKAILGNPLQINQELFELCKERAVKVSTILTHERQEKDGRRNDLQQQSQEEVQDKDKSLSLIAPCERNIKLLYVDIPRTFGKHPFFEAGSVGHTHLQQVLEAYTCYRPDLGYVQGMSYLAATLCFHMDAFDAFKAMAALLSGRLLFDMYRLEEDRTLHYINVFDKIVAHELPSLAAHFESIGMDGKMYMVDWALTLFTRVLPLNVAYRLWDIFLQVGSTFFFQASVGILLVMEDSLLSMELEDVMATLHSLPEDLSIDDILDGVSRVSISRSEIRDWLNQLTQECWSPVSSANVERKFDFPVNY